MESMKNKKENNKKILQQTREKLYQKKPIQK